MKKIALALAVCLISSAPAFATCKSDAADRRALAEGLLEDTVGDLRLALHDLRQPVDLAAVDVEVFDAALERHQRLLALRIQWLSQKRDVEARGARDRRGRERIVRGKRSQFSAGPHERGNLEPERILQHRLDGALEHLSLIHI